MPKAIWITGLPGSGKSTVAEAFRKKHPEFLILRMDELRKIVTPRPSYSETERELVYRCIVYTAKTLIELGHDVIIDATGNMRRWRELAREVIPDFAEVYLKCSISECLRRERLRRETHAAPRDIYEKGKKGWPVPGVAVPYEEPLNPEVVIDTEVADIEEAVRIMETALKYR
ncbi:MAG: adenylyl-sulfate kinase [Nitrospirota bacterium]|nr:adenylyl-sulfate kinase [Nitrospirota bacterium]